MPGFPLFDARSRYEAEIVSAPSQSPCFADIPKISFRFKKHLLKIIFTVLKTEV